LTRGPDAPERKSWRPYLFGAGLATVAVALVSPLDGVARTSLAAHMVQHVLLLVVAAALLVAAAPMPTLLAGLPRSVRDNAAHGWALVSASARSRRWPWWMAAAVVVQTAVMWAWHAPALYGAALDDKAVHAMEHLSFLGAGLFFFGALAAAVAARRGAGVVVMFVAALPGTALGAALTLAPRPWYPAYPSLEDQQLAGVVMWGFAGAVYVMAAGVVFGLWLAAEDKAAKAEAEAEAGAEVVPSPGPTAVGADR
jgi:cytochrome c oxidase assembly factor CtaG